MASNVVIIVVGGRGTGKTDFIKDEIITQSPLPKKLTVDTFDSPPWRTLKTFKNPQNDAIQVPIMPIDKLAKWKEGIYRIATSDPEYTFAMIDQHLRNALVIFEDATKYIGSTLTKETRKFIYDSKQKNLNLVFIFHSLASVPPELVRASDYLTLFKTNEGRPSKDKYPFPEIPIAMEKVRESENHFENYTIRLN